MVIIAGVYRVSGRTLQSKKFKSYIVSSHKYEAVICDNFYKNKVTLNIHSTSIELAFTMFGISFNNRVQILKLFIHSI